MVTTNAAQTRIVACMQILVSRIADEASSLAPAEAERHVATEVFAFFEGLSEISEPICEGSDVLAHDRDSQGTREVAALKRPRAV